MGAVIFNNSISISTSAIYSEPAVYSQNSTMFILSNYSYAYGNEISNSGSHPFAFNLTGQTSKFVQGKS